MDMEQVDDIMLKCAELGKSIAQTSIYKEFKKAEYDLLHNPEARKLVEDLQKVQQDQYRKKIAGIEISKEEQEKIKKLENICIQDTQVLMLILIFRNLWRRSLERSKKGLKALTKSKCKVLTLYFGSIAL